ncbi:hypothetical protein P4O66_003218 [Electrophorus voltai]|uniref:Uncharacterized protein n=1 Tax=Electrophorus voltai TaxID=2609070 RepID=A0AAD8YRF3_9TELE|nr:hypothetical protein P4O66_003218 [Electrophorus voltai]
MEVHRDDKWKFFGSDRLVKLVPLDKGITLGIWKNCCMMTLTILDEAQRPFWCVSSPVTLLLVRCPLMEESYSSEQFLMRYCDAKGEVKMNFVWMQGLQQYFLIGTQIRISMDKLSKHFRERESRGY